MILSVSDWWGGVGAHMGDPEESISQIYGATTMRNANSANLSLKPFRHAHLFSWKSSLSAAAAG